MAVAGIDAVRRASAGSARRPGRCASGRNSGPPFLARDHPVQAAPSRPGPHMFGRVDDDVDAPADVAARSPTDSELVTSSGTISTLGMAQRILARERLPRRRRRRRRWRSRRPTDFCRSLPDLGAPSGDRARGGISGSRVIFAQLSVVGHVGVSVRGAARRRRLSAAIEFEAHAHAVAVLVTSPCTWATIDGRNPFSLPVPTLRHALAIITVGRGADGVVVDQFAIGPNVAERRLGKAAVGQVSRGG